MGIYFTGLKYTIKVYQQEVWRDSKLWYKFSFEIQLLVIFGEKRQWGLLFTDHGRFATYIYLNYWSSYENRQKMPKEYIHLRDQMTL